MSGALWARRDGVGMPVHHGVVTDDGGGVLLPDGQLAYGGIGN